MIRRRTWMNWLGTVKNNSNRSRCRLTVERLEDRRTPATVTYTTASGALQFAADAGDVDSVTISAASANTVQIDVANGDTIVLAGDAIANGDFVLSNGDTTLTINTSSSPATTFSIQLGDMGDLLNFSLANTTNGVGSVTIDAQAGEDTVQVGNTTTGGGFSTEAEFITFAANAQVVAITGNISFTATDTLGAGQDLILNSGVSLQATAGSVSLLAGDDVKLNAGSSVQANTTITIQGDFGDQDNGTGSTIEINGTVTATSLSATGGNDSDSFTVTPSATTEISLTGGLPGTAPGDSLAFNMGGAADATLQITFMSGDTRDGIATFSNRQNVSFNTMETLPGIDLSVSANDNPDPAVAGGSLTLTVTVANNSAFGISGITVTDNFPVGFTSPNWTANFAGAGSTGTASGSGNISETITLAAGGSVTYTITGVVDTGFSGTLTNTATASLPNGFTDPDTNNNSASSDTTVAFGSDLAVSVVDSPDPVLVNGQLTYTVTITNNGPVTATGIVGANTLPGSFTLQFAQQSHGSFVTNGNVITWTVGDLASGASATLTIVGTATQAGTITNAFAITSVHVDPNQNNNSANTDTSVVFPSIIAVGAGPGNTPTVQVYDGATGTLKYSFEAYASNFRGGVHVATGDMNGDGVADIITGAGAGGGPHVRVFNGVNGTPLSGPLSSFMAYNPFFRGGVTVAVGDVNMDGKLDIITGAGPGGGPHVQVFSGDNGSVIYSFYAYSSAFVGGVRVASGDVNNDGRDDIITGAGPGGGPHVVAFSGLNRSILHSFYAYTANFSGGVFVASGDLNGDDHDDIITGAGAGGGPHVRAFNGQNLTQLLGFMALDPSFGGGVSVGAVDSNNNGQMDIVTGPGRNGDRRVRVFNGATAAQVTSFTTFDAAFLGGIFVGGK